MLDLNYLINLVVLNSLHINNSKAITKIDVGRKFFIVF